MGLTGQMDRALAAGLAVGAAGPAAALVGDAAAQAAQGSAVEPVEPVEPVAQAGDRRQDCHRRTARICIACHPLVL
jgi:hypothetical protein